MPNVSSNDNPQPGLYIRRLTSSNYATGFIRQRGSDFVVPKEKGTDTAEDNHWRLLVAEDARKAERMRWKLAAIHAAQYSFRMVPEAKGSRKKVKKAFLQALVEFDGNYNTYAHQWKDTIGLKDKTRMEIKNALDLDGLLKGKKIYWFNEDEFEVIKVMIQRENGSRPSEEDESLTNDEADEDTETSDEDEVVEDASDSDDDVVSDDGVEVVKMRE